MASTYWRGYNIVRRGVGLAFAGFGSLGLLLSAAAYVLRGEPLWNQDHVTHALGARLLATLVWLVPIALGVALLRARSYRPDLGDRSRWTDPIEAKLQRTHPVDRHWWTGDPRRRQPPAA